MRPASTAGRVWRGRAGGLLLLFAGYACEPLRFWGAARAYEQLTGYRRALEFFFDYWKNSTLPHTVHFRTIRDDRRDGPRTTYATSPPLSLWRQRAGYLNL